MAREGAFRWSWMMIQDFEWRSVVENCFPERQFKRKPTQKAMQ